MRSKSTIILLVIISLGSAMVAGGCRKGDRARVEKSREEIAASTTAEDEKNVDLTIDSKENEGADLPERQEIRRKFQLKSDDLVAVSGINGNLKVESTDGDEAEVLIVRSAKNRDDLQYRKMRIEQKAEGLFIRSENDRKSIFSSLGGSPEVRQRVHLKLPRKIDFETNGINGTVKISEIAGRLEIRGVTGSVDVARAGGETDVNGINGNVDLTFAPLKGSGIEIRGVNGNVGLKFEGEVNAELRTWGVNGDVSPELPNVENRDEQSRRGSIKARIGSGGSPIEISGVNGNVRLTKAQTAAATEAKAGKK